MCGIIAYIGADEALDPVLGGLSNLEYRGYDSAGIAIREGSTVAVCKRAGEIAELREAVPSVELSGRAAIGHTRWSTHGPPTDDNAHPHTDCTGRIAVVHNGIIENYEALKAELQATGHQFTSETDTEVVPHLIEQALDEGRPPEAAFRSAIARLEGSFAIAAIVEASDELYAARQGSPLVVGIGEGKRFLASDVPAFIERTDRVVYLQDGDVVTVDATDHRITDLEGSPRDRPVEHVDWQPEDARKGGYPHYMLKEIHEQPTSIRQTLEGRIDPETNTTTLDEFDAGTFADVDRVQLIACGTSYHAALCGVHFLTDRGIAAEAFVASEYATSPPPRTDGTLVVAVTQSGETADTLEALREARTAPVRTVAVTNVVGSTVTREVDDTVFIRAGPEIGVAATKTFSSQVATLLLLSARLAADAEGRRSARLDPTVVADFDALPETVEAIIRGSNADEVVNAYLDRSAYFFIGRGLAYPVALEGALKFKEITYEHAEGFPAGELKHGPLALITSNTPVVAVCTGRHEQRLVGNVHEIKARDAPVIAVAPESATALRNVADDVLSIPSGHPDVAAILANVQLQLLAYHAANSLGRAIDKPRNLAKSVTVE